MLEAVKNLQLSLADDTRQHATGMLDGAGWTVATGGATASGAQIGQGAAPQGAGLLLIVAAIVGAAFIIKRKG